MTVRITTSIYTIQGICGKLDTSEQLFHTCLIFNIIMIHNIKSYCLVLKIATAMKHCHGKYKYTHNTMMIQLYMENHTLLTITVNHKNHYIIYHYCWVMKRVRVTKLSQDKYSYIHNT